MKESNLTSLKLNKKVISKFDNNAVKGGANESMPLTKCKLPLDHDHTFKPVPNPDDGEPI